MANDPTFSDDDTEWLRALQTGDAKLHPDVPHVRQALKARAQHLDETVPVADEHMYEQLQFRLRKERLLGSRPSNRTLLAVAASAVMAVGLGIALLPNFGEPEHQVLRGSNPNVVVVADPQRSAQEALEKLRTAGLKPQLRSQDRAAVVLVPASLEAVEMLDQLKLPSVKVAGQLEIRFESRR